MERSLQATSTSVNHATRFLCAEWVLTFMLSLDNCQIKTSFCFVFKANFHSGLTSIQYNASNFTASIKSVLLWSQSIGNSWWPTRVLRFIMLRGFCEPSVYWSLCSHWSSLGQAKPENLLQGTYILLGTFFWNTGWYFMSLESILRAFNSDKYRKTSKNISRYYKRRHLIIYLLSIHKIWRWG